MCDRKGLANALVMAAMDHLTEFWARELSNNVACWDRDFWTVRAIAKALRWRIQHYGTECSDVEACAAAMARAAWKFICQR